MTFPDHHPQQQRMTSGATCAHEVDMSAPCSVCLESFSRLERKEIPPVMMLINNRWAFPEMGVPLNHHPNF